MTGWSAFFAVVAGMVIFGALTVGGLYLFFKYAPYLFHSIDRWEQEAAKRIAERERAKERKWED